jgi:ribosomal protein S12 methylthiotransferase
VGHVCALAEELTAQRAEDRVGERVEVLVERRLAASAEGRAECQGPEVDGTTMLTELPAGVVLGDIVTAEVTGTSGVDLIAVPVRS